MACIERKLLRASLKSRAGILPASRSFAKYPARGMLVAPFSGPRSEKGGSPAVSNPLWSALAGRRFGFCRASPRVPKSKAESSLRTPKTRLATNRLVLVFAWLRKRDFEHRDRSHPRKLKEHCSGAWKKYGRTRVDRINGIHGMRMSRKARSGQF